MKTGPKPIPRNLRVVSNSDPLEGRDRPANPIPEPAVKAPPPPDYLNDAQKEVFVARAKLLAGMRVMSDADVDLLAMYALNWVEARKARAKVEATGEIIASPKGYPIHNPYLSIARKAEDRCLRIMLEFGLTPSSRNRVSQ